MEKVGLIGIGLVGSALAENLVQSGRRVIGCDVRPERLAVLQAIGGEPAGNPAELVSRLQADGDAGPILILSLMDTPVVKQVLDGPAGLLGAARPGLVIIDTTTGDPDEETAIAARLAGRGIAYLDATISGSSEQIRRREGVFMVGGDETVYRRLDGLFGALAEKRFFVGPSGSGARAKLASNLILGLNRLALAEGLVFAERLGLEPKAFLELLRSTPAYSRAVDSKGRKMIEADFAAEAKLAQHAKDLRMILDYAGRAGQGLPMAALHERLLEAAIADGEGELDNSAVIRQLRKNKPGSMS